MSTMPREYSSGQRTNRAYIEIPPSPLTLHRRVAVSALHVVQNNMARKENTPLKSFSLPMSYVSTSAKRKLADLEPSLEMVPPKKSNLFSVPNVATLNVEQVTMHEPTNKIAEEFPNGYVYCHQCNKKRDLNNILKCNATLEHTTKYGNSKQSFCKYKYCKNCLKNRYSEARFENAISGFKCPRCRDICNCRKCRKAKGLEPIRVISKSLLKNAPTDTKPDLEVKETQQAIESAPRELPVLKWRRVPVNLTVDEVNDRIFIREFFFRFGDVLDPPLAKSNLEELEFLSGRSRKFGDQDDASYSWANESCLKALFLGLLGLLAKTCEDDVAKMITVTVKELRGGGTNLNKVWLALHTLRAKISQIISPDVATNSKISQGDTLWFPDPLPPSASATTRSLRSVRMSTNTVNVFHSSQMIPVLISLIHTALETSIIREELEQGAKNNKEYARGAKEAIRIENERWEKEKKIIEVGSKDKAQKAETRVKRSAHKSQLTNIENALKIIGPSFAPRFTTLGTDDDGRIYYALSPGVAEREAAFEYIEVASGEKVMKLKKKGRVLSVEERKEMKEWSWFIAVWGTRPPSPSNEAKITTVQKMKVDEAEDEDEDEENGLNWWGFWNPEDIMKLAEWISVRFVPEEGGEGLAEKDSQSTSSMNSTSSSSNRRHPRVEQLKRLVGHLREYASLLQWRTRSE